MSSINEIEITTPYGDIDNVLELNIDSISDAYVLQNVIKFPGTYTFSIWYQTECDSQITFNILGEPEIIPSSTSWNKYVKTVTVETLEETNIYIIPNENVNSYFYEGYLVEGITDTSWLPAPEDIESEIGSVRSELRQTADSILLKVSDSNGRITTLETNLEGITGRVEDAEGNISKVTQTVNGIETEISDAKGSSTTLKARLDGIDTSVINAEKNAKSFATQEADRIQSTVTQGYTDAISAVEIGGRNLIENSSFSEIEPNGIYTFDGDTVTFYSDTIGNITTNEIAFKLNMSEYFISNCRGKTLTYSMEYLVEEAITYGDTKPWIGFQLYVGRNEITGGSTQYLNWYGGKTFPVDTTDGWIKYSIQRTISDYDISTALITFYMRDAIGKIKFRHPKVELGNKATDWTPAPEDVNASIEKVESNFIQRADSIELSVNEAQESADIAQGTASDAQLRVEVAESLIKLLSDNISMLVTDGSGTSLMKQTENGWTFSTSEIQNSLNDMSKNLNDLTTEFGNTDAVLSILKQSIGDIETKTDYVNIGTWEDEPCIELGESDSDFSVMITNTRILFRVGSDAPTRITTDGLETDNITVNNEWRQGSFVWKVRANGNYGLSWKGVNS